MCGIAGVMSLERDLLPPSIEQLTRMAGALRHRGPDEFGVYRDRTAGLAHARLSIIDLVSGQQPLSNEDETLWIVFNGEIFNYLELREELIALGHRFRTRSDTEVIVHAYEAWGDSAFVRFNGQFALALWNSETQSLVLARDRFGIRPLYFCQRAGRLYFASEVKAIFVGEPRIDRSLDPIGLDQTFTFWSTVAPRTVFEGVEQLKPGHVRTYRNGRFVERAYWSPRYPGDASSSFAGSIDEAAAAVRGALEEATELRMLRADVPVGSYLSGGLDSSLVASLALQAKRDKFRTFSIRFEDAEYDETEFQRLMSGYLGSDHYEVVVSRADIARVFPEVILHTEVPILRTAPAPLFLLSQKVREAGIKVVLTGEGADEIFAGYDLFREAKVRRFWARQPRSKLRPRLLERLYPYLARSPVARQAMAREFFGRNLDRSADPGFSHQIRWHAASALKRLFAPELRRSIEGRDSAAELLGSIPADFARWTPLAQDQYLEIRTILSGYILSSQGDRMLMAHGVEGRFPFLDPNVVDLAASLPPKYKLRALNEKFILKRVAQGRVPLQIIRRKKQPYRAPDGLAFVGSDSDGWIEDVLRPERVAEAGIFDPTAVSQLWKKCRAPRGEAQLSNSDNMAIVGVLSTQLLHAQFIRRAPAEDSPITAKTITDRLERPFERHPSAA